jgi:hypothetical protein
MEPAFSTPEEELFVYLYAIRSTGQVKMTKEQHFRMAELLTELVARGLNTFEQIFQEVWRLKPEKHGKSEEMTRLRIYEFVSRAVMHGLLIKNGRQYSVAQRIQQ